jgi:tyrosine-protein phosphatase SIW14
MTWRCADFKIPLGTTLWSPLTDWKPIRDEIVKSALEIIMDTRNHPVLLIDPYVFPSRIQWCEADGRLGIHQTGCVVGALRVLQDWNFASILVEVCASY